RFDVGGDVVGHTFGVEVDQCPGWRSRTVVDEIPGAGYRVRVVLQLRNGGDFGRADEIGPQSAKRDGLLCTAVHDVLGEVRSRLTRGACCGALSHPALRTITASLPLLIEEDALRHDRVGAALFYQRNFRSHSWPSEPMRSLKTRVIGAHCAAPELR